jgi:flavodoxin I
MRMISVIYASAGGATREVATELARQLGPRTRLIDLATFSWADDWSVLVNDLVIAGGPTYGRGDWHHLWASRFREVAPILAAARKVALFGLGDTRFHGQTFCGGLGHLHAAVVALAVKPVGFTDPGRHSYRSTPSLHEGRFPGLVVDHRLDHRQIPEIAGGWLETLPIGHHQIARASIFPTSTQHQEPTYVSQYPDRNVAAFSVG